MKPSTHLDTIPCPDCSSPAEITDRFILESTDGPLESIRIQCITRKHFFCGAVGELLGDG